MLKNITFSVEEELILKASEKAMAEKITLNVAFRKWLKQYAEKERISEEYDQVMESLKHVYSGRKFTRDEMNER
jgi:hypothetical protein